MGCNGMTRELITAESLEWNRVEHQRKTSPKMWPYGVSGYRWAKQIAVFASKIGAEDILDYGAGKATLCSALPNVRNYDPVTFPGEPSPADLVVCTDVLPFVEPSVFENVLDHITSLAIKGIFFIVPTHPPYKAHPHMVTRQPHEWAAILKQRWPHGQYQILDEGTKRLRFTARAGIAIPDRPDPARTSPYDL